MGVFAQVLDELSVLYRRLLTPHCLNVFSDAFGQSPLPEDGGHQGLEYRVLKVPKMLRLRHHKMNKRGVFHNAFLWDVPHRRHWSVMQRPARQVKLAQ
ncbi:hypothetical protein D3C85_1670840 [compost metagenome]